MTLHRILFSSLLMILLSPLVASAAPAAGISRIGYAIQIGAFAEVKNAERLTFKLQEKGIEAFYFKKENGLYAVRFGDFPRRDDARNIAKKLVSVKSIRSGKHTTIDKGEPMDIKEFRAMIHKSEKSGFISVDQLEANWNF